MMSEIERERLKSMDKWTPVQALEAALLDTQNGQLVEGQAGTLISVQIMMVVEMPPQGAAPPRVRLPWYQGGFDSVPAQLGYLEAFRRQLLEWWYKE